MPDLSLDVINKIIELGQPGTVDVAGFNYSTRQLHPVKYPSPDSLTLSTLQGLVNYIVRNVDTLEAKDLMVVVDGPEDVRLISNLTDTEQRDTFLACDLPHEVYQFGHWQDQEAFTIALQTQFMATPERDNLLQVVGALTAEEITLSEDDGVSQKITARAGVALKDRLTLPSPVALKPFRTFREVDQPESIFILRAKKGSMGVALALYEADGGAWRLQAISNIAQWLESKISTNVAILA